MKKYYVRVEFVFGLHAGLEGRAFTITHISTHPDR